MTLREFDIVQKQITNTLQPALATVLILAALVGCKSHGMLAKREAEKCCPTDIRKTVPWCAGEDAIFQCPCEPNPAFYGHKPTCWRTWPADGATWRDIYCGDQHHRAIMTELTNKNSELIVLPKVEALPAIPEKAADQAELDGPPTENGAPADAPSATTNPQPEPAPDPPQLRLFEKTPPAQETPAQETPAQEAPAQEPAAMLEPPILGPIPLPDINAE